MGLQQSLRGIDGTAGGVGILAHAPAHDHDRSVKTYFDHEKLDVYREAIAFCGWVGDLLNEITHKAAAKDQLDRASTSLPLNIAEGNGKFSTTDRLDFLKSREVRHWSVQHVWTSFPCGGLSVRNE